VVQPAHGSRVDPDFGRRNLLHHVFHLRIGNFKFMLLLSTLYQDCFIGLNSHISIVFVKKVSVILKPCCKESLNQLEKVCFV